MLYYVLTFSDADVCNCEIELTDVHIIAFGALRFCGRYHIGHTRISAKILLNCFSWCATHNAVSVLGIQACIYDFF